MEGCGKKRLQEDPISSAVQGRNCDRNRRSKNKSGSRCEFKESSESRSESPQAKEQTEHSAWRVRRQSRSDQPVISSRDFHSSDNKNVFRVVYTNARSIIGKIDLLKAYVFDLKPAAVCICEASTNDLISNAFLNLDGYSLVVRADGKDTKDDWCRGLLIYLRIDIRAERIDSELIDNLVECEGVRIPWGNNGEMLSLLLVYRPPRPSGSEADRGTVKSVVIF